MCVHGVDSSLHCLVANATITVQVTEAHIYQAFGMNYDICDPVCEKKTYSFSNYTCLVTYSLIL